MATWLTIGKSFSLILPQLQSQQRLGLDIVGILQYDLFQIARSKPQRLLSWLASCRRLFRESVSEPRRCTSSRVRGIVAAFDGLLHKSFGAFTIVDVGQGHTQ